MDESILDILEARRTHLARLATTRGAKGEASVLSASEGWLPRPKGKHSKNLRAALEAKGIKIKITSFDMISMTKGQSVDFNSVESITNALPNMIFLEVKTANKEIVQPGFGRFFFAFTEHEISASKQLGQCYRVVLYNSRTKELLITSLQEVMARAGSSTWQVSIQLKPTDL